MNPATKTIMVSVMLTVLGGPVAYAASTDKYPNYYAALRALKSGDCATGVGYLNAYLQHHSYIREKHREHYEDIKLVIYQCTDKIIIKGVENKSLEIDPLPDHPPIGQ